MIIVMALQRLLLLIFVCLFYYYPGFVNDIVYKNALTE